MSMGMSYDDYWYGDVEIAKYYYKADLLRQERENVNAWWAGKYIHEAVSTAVYNIFRKEGQPQAYYPKQPYPISKSEVEKQKQEEKASNAVLAKAWLSNLVLVGANWGKEDKNE